MKELWTKENEKLLKMDFDGMGTKEIAEVTGLKYFSIAGTLSRHRLKYFLFKHGMKVVNSIKQSNNLGTSVEDIAKRFKTRPSVISSITRDSANYRLAVEQLRERL